MGYEKNEARREKREEKKRVLINFRVIFPSRIEKEFKWTGKWRKNCKRRKCKSELSKRRALKVREEIKAKLIYNCKLRFINILKQRNIEEQSGRESLSSLNGKSSPRVRGTTEEDTKANLMFQLKIMNTQLHLSMIAKEWPCFNDLRDRIWCRRVPRGIPQA